MQLLVSIGVRFLLYIVIAFPLFRGIFGFAGDIFSFILAFIFTAVAASVLEARGLTKKVIDYVNKLLGGQLNAASGTVAKSIGDSILPSVSYIECPNCGAQITLNNGKGTCASCDTPFSHQ